MNGEDRKENQPKVNLIQTDKLPFERSQTFFSLYANQFLISFSPVDFRITFCRIEINRTQDDSKIVEAFDVYLPMSMALELSNALRGRVGDYLDLAKARFEGQMKEPEVKPQS